MQEDDIIDEEFQIADERFATLGSAILTKPIRALKVRLPIVIRPEMSVREAIRSMVRNKVGCVLIAAEDKLVGIFSERDVLTEVVAKGMDPDETTVESVMTSDPETLTPESGISYALNKMSVGGFRHVPLIDESGRPVAVLSMRDVVDYIVDLFPGDILNLPPEPGVVPRSREGA